MWRPPFLNVTILTSLSSYLAEIRDAEKGIDLALDMTYKSDILIPQELKEELKAAVKPLEDIPERLKDWHPNSMNQVLDLVHPSLYPLVIGKSLRSSAQPMIPCLPHAVGGMVVQLEDIPRQPRIISEEFSTQHQWLPADFTIDPTTKAVRFESYINNLHPVKHKKLYYALEKVFTLCVPMFDRVLFDLLNPPSQRVKIEAPDWYPDQQQEGDEEGDDEDGDDEEGDDEDEEPEEEGEDEEEAQNSHEEDPDEESSQSHETENMEDYDDVVHEYGSDFGRRRLVIPGFDKFERPERIFNEVKSEGFDMFTGSKETLSDFGRGQVIIKLANIELTPENPHYTGGGWHLEGMAVSYPCATFILHMKLNKQSE